MGPPLPIQRADRRRTPPRDTLGGPNGRLPLHTKLRPRTLAAVDDALGQLVVLLLIGAAWLVKGIADAKRKRDLMVQRRPEDPDVDASPRRQPSPPVRVPPMSPAPLSPVPWPPVPTAPPPTPPAARFPPALVLAPSSSTAPRPWRHGPARRRRLRHRALRALAGGGPVRDPARMVRAGILWREVLGPPRALRGPHRAPCWSRYRRGDA
jgi:hypothetical protein